MSHDSVVDLLKRVALTAFGRIVLKTPVDLGRAQNAWQIGINSEPTGENGPGIEALSGIEPGSTVNIGNNVPYIVALENGHSRQAPTGMVGVTMEEMRAEFAGNVK